MYLPQHRRRIIILMPTATFCFMGTPTEDEG